MQNKGVVKGFTAPFFIFQVICMAIMVKKLYKNGSFLYKMELLAGKGGLSNLVKWVHIIEDETVVSFLHGGELVFTAGILNRREDWMLRFAQRLHRAGASAMVVNLGPHTREIPGAVIQYCDEIDMPLFTIPWETKMVDMTRDFCHRIMRNEQMENNIVSALKDILFSPGHAESRIAELRQYGYQAESRFCFISLCISCIEPGTEEKGSLITAIAEKTAKDIREPFITFPYQENRIFVLIDYEEEEMDSFLTRFSEEVKRQAPALQLHMGVSSNQTGIHEQSANFEKAVSAMEMAKKRNEKIAYYDRLGVYKMLYALNDKSILRDYYRDVMGKLEQYDRDNNTKLMQTLRIYLENNGSLLLVSEKQYTHRNTVTNQLKKIETITGLNPFELEDKVKFYLSLYIKDIL
ncbi:PucR C-terminal helix-turn-helix domain-containing protein [Papillibacter cinnamivorans DSM 12816]|uniref:PucR C-terminal helix-turn-helix domain-containing protein n=2 Tax=Papillibacter TaxID=100175 RepID=A0A1W2AUS4_9FIRM|nr:PucR C-terminal helix-turn-helix domain-containing protein [Papillibacter cinnamivorans DSM 12816]